MRRIFLPYYSSYLYWESVFPFTRRREANNQMLWM